MLPLTSKAYEVLGVAKPIPTVPPLNTAAYREDASESLPEEETSTYKP